MRRAKTPGEEQARDLPVRRAFDSAATGIPLQHAFNLFQYRLRDEPVDPASSGECEYLIGHSAEVEGGDVDVGVSDDPEHSAFRSVLLEEPLDIRFLDSQLT